MRRQKIKEQVAKELSNYDKKIIYDHVDAIIDERNEKIFNFFIVAIPSFFTGFLISMIIFWVIL